MGEQLGTSDLWWSGIGVPDPRHTIWADECSYTPYDRVVAEVVPAQTTGLVLAATGTPSSSTALEFKAQTGGTPGIDGARFVWRESGATSWRGWIPPTRVTWWAPVSASRTGRYPKALSLPNGKILVVYNEDPGSQEQVSVLTYDPSTDVVSSTEIIVHRTLNGGSTFGLHPTPLLLEDGTILVLSYRYESSLVGVTVHASDDNGATWRLWSESSIPTFAATPLRMSAAYANGQILLLTEWEDAFVVKGAAYASADLGITFTQVSGFDFDEKRHKTVVAAGGYFVLLYVLDDYNDTASASGFRPKSARTANAFTPFGAVSNVGSVSQGSGSSGSSLDEVAPDVAVAVEESGAIWAYYTGRPGTQSMGRAFRSSDAGATWTTLPDGADRRGVRWWDQTTDAYPWWISAVYHQGAVWMVGNRRSDNLTINNDMMGLVALGGWQSVTWGRKVQVPNDVGAPTWTATWLPYEDLDDAGSDFTVSAVAGTWTNAVTGGAYHRALGDTSSAILSILEAPSASLEDSTVRYSVEVTSGTLSTIVQVADATSKYAARVQLDSAGNLYVYDPNNPDSPTAITGLTGRVDIMVTVGQYVPSGDYVAIVWYSAAKGPHKTWTVARQMTLADGGGPSTWRTQFLISGSGSAPEVRFYEIHRLYAQDADPDDADGQGLIRLWHNGATFLPAPAPYGRALPGVRAAYAGNGVSLRGSGRATPGHTWTMTPGESYGPDRCLPASWPMASDRFRSTGTGAVAWLVDDDTVRPHTPAWYFWIEGNVSQGTLAVHDGTSWADHVTLDTRLALTFQRTGSSVYANVTTASAIVDVAPFIEHGELVGGYFDLGGGDVRKIVRQTSGTRERNANSSATRTKRIHLELEGIDGTEATSGTGYIRPPRALLLIKTSGLPDTLKGWRFTPSDSATAEGYWDYKAHLGPVHMVGRMPQWGSRLQIEHRNDTNESPDGRWESTQLAPPRAIWTGGWSDPIYRGAVQANSTSPAARGILVTDYDEYGTDAAPGNPLGYAEGELPGMLRGLLDELRGSQTPIVWIPVAPRLWMESGVPTFNPYSWPWQGGTMATIQRQAGALYGVIVSDIDIQHQVGTEGIEDAVRVGTLEVRELR